MMDKPDMPDLLSHMLSLNLDEERLGQLKEKLSELGVESRQDLTLVEETELVPPLKIIEARKFLSRQHLAKGVSMPESPQPGFIGSSQGFQVCSSFSPPSVSGLTSPNSSTSQQGMSDLDSSTSTVLYPYDSANESDYWADKFCIPWNMLHRNLVKKCEKGDVPTSAERKNLIHRVCDEVIRCVGPKPSFLRWNIKKVAAKIIQRYPRSFQDTIDDEVVGSGIGSLSIDLENRIYYMQRSKPKQVVPSSSAGSRRTLINETSPQPPQKKTKVDVSQDETISDVHDDNEEKQSWLQKHFCKTNEWDCEKVDHLMDDTYQNRRELICQKKPVKQMIEDYPFLFQPRWLFRDFEKLREGISRESLMERVREKSGRILAFMQHQKRGSVDIDDSSTVLRSLVHYFKEDLATLLRVYDEVPLVSSIESDKTKPTTPFIAILDDRNDTSDSSKSYLLVIEKEIAIRNGLETFHDALAALMVSFWVMWMSYPKSSVNTLEFIEKCVMKISGESRKQQRGKSVGPVLTLVKGIREFESDW